MLCSNYAAVIAMTCMAVMNFTSTPQPTSWDMQQQEIQEAEPVDLIASVNDLGPIDWNANIKIGS